MTLGLKESPLALFKPALDRVISMANMDPAMGIPMNAVSEPAAPA